MIRTHDFCDTGAVGRALHWVCRGHGFESHSGLKFFQVLISYLPKLCDCITTMINHAMFNVALEAGNMHNITRLDK